MSTHLVDEAADLLEHFVMLDQGESCWMRRPTTYVARPSPSAGRRVGNFFSSSAALVLTGILAAAAVVFGIGGYTTLRRTTV